MSKINNWFLLSEDIRDDKQYYTYSLEHKYECLDRFAILVKDFSEETIQSVLYYIHNNQKWSIFQNGDYNSTGELLGYGCGNGRGTINGGGCD